MDSESVIIEVLLKFTEPYLAIGETYHDKVAYLNLMKVCHIHDYCYDLIRKNAELTGKEYSVCKAREKAIQYIKESVQTMTELLNELEGNKGEE